MRILWWTATVIAISLSCIVFSQQGATKPLQNLSLTINSPLAGGLRDMARPLDDFFLGLTDRGDINRENQQLREELEKYKVQLAGQQDAEARVKDLEAALGLRQSRPEDQLLAANVIAEEPSGLKRLVAIDRGLDDGLDEGMIILSRSGSLIGTISRAYKNFAWVQLVTDPDSAINVQVNAGQRSPGQATAPSTDVLTPATPSPRPGGAAGTPTPVPQTAATPAPSASPATATPPAEPVRAVADGDLRKNIVLGLLPAGSAVTRGDLVVTSGHGGNYPRGLLVGTIKDIDEQTQAPFLSATVEPAASLSGLDTVLVLVNFKPTRLIGP